MASVDAEGDGHRSGLRGLPTPDRPFITQLLQDGELHYLKRLVIEAEDNPDLNVAFERRLTMVLDGLTARIDRPSRRKRIRSET